ncbi:hypothetical protein BpHYR1_027439 [Brachionus plicatilis]|uniref:Uncharacterized protein n=1 Tax=Brachionus plicatilis TaxID=10195 RepID=A0A3M7RW74_BRAPC|nr:hypothetical protein BpHYR1_027439 [Brachionus plicatilis]
MVTIFDFLVNLLLPKTQKAFYLGIGQIIKESLKKRKKNSRGKEMYQNLQFFDFEIFFQSTTNVKLKT